MGFETGRRTCASVKLGAVSHFRVHRGAVRRPVKLWPVKLSLLLIAPALCSCGVEQPPADIARQGDQPGAGGTGSGGQEIAQAGRLGSGGEDSTAGRVEGSGGQGLLTGGSVEPLGTGGADAALDGSVDDVGATVGHGNTIVATSSAARVELFVNGAAVGPGRPGAWIAKATIEPGRDNVIVVRAHAAVVSDAALAVDLQGPFGRLGSSARWKVKVASGDEVKSSTAAWFESGYDDSAWENAQPVLAAGGSDLPPGGTAVPVWSASSSDGVILLRLVFYVPAGWSPDVPAGFGRDVTGGAGGEVVTVSTITGLVNAVHGATPRIIQVMGTIDFTGTEGQTSAQVCYQKRCPAPLESELITNQQGACSNSGMGTFLFSYDKAGTTPLTVGSNKTIIGLGADAIIRGKGLSLRGGVSNVIVRNLTLSEINAQLIWGGDALTIDDADRVWIDHVKFSLIGRQMLVTGFGKASNVTLSWNEFDGVTPYAAYCDGRHYWVWLLLGAADTITLANNWVHHTSGRAPHAGGLRQATVAVHMVNNYFDDIAGHAADPDTALTQLLLEGNFFHDVERPIDVDRAAPGNISAPVAGASQGLQRICMAELSRSCEPNLVNPASGPFPEGPGVLSTFGRMPTGSLMTPYPASHVPHTVPHLAGPGHLSGGL